MIIETVEAKVTSNIPQGDVIKSTIDDEGMEHIMKLLTNLYQNPELAVIREYYTNALDAHVAVGQTKPVEVTLPTWDKPNYVVKDFGIGMSRDDIKNVYSKYGASTKRKTNNQVGAFGLGCKSALTIATQFTVVTVKDGWKTTVLFTKSASGVADINVVNHVETTDHNGTTVSIPVKGSQYAFNAEARKFFGFSAPGLVLVDGVAPESAYDGMIEVVSNDEEKLKAFISVDHYNTESYLIMGNVPYVLSNTEINDSLGRLGRAASREFNRIAKYFPVNIGDVDLTPSREGLLFNDRTNAVIDRYMSFIIDDLKSLAEKEANAVTGLKEFWEIQKRWEHIVPGSLTWNGTVVPKFIDLKEDYRKIRRSAHGSSSHSVSSRFMLNPNGHMILIKGFTAAKYAKLNAYITPYMNSQNLSNAVFVICGDDDLFTNEWVLKHSYFTIIDGQEIIDKGREQRKKEREAIKSAGVAPAEKMTYPVIDVDEETVKWVPYNEIPEGTPYLWKATFGGDSVHNLIDSVYNQMGYSVSMNTYNRRDVLTHLKTVTDVKQVILMSTARTPEALERRVKKTYSLKTIFSKVNDELKTKTSDEVALRIGLNDTHLVTFLKDSGVAAKIDQVEDELLRSVVAPSDDIKKDLEKTRAIIKSLKVFNFYSLTPSIDSTKSQEVAQNLRTKYPLMDVISSYSVKGRARDHLITYFNTIHKMEEDPVTAQEEVNDKLDALKGTN